MRWDVKSGSVKSDSEIKQFKTATATATAQDVITAMLGNLNSAPHKIASEAASRISAMLIQSTDSGLFTRDIDINDVKHRYLLTKTSTKLDIKKQSGADVISKGKYYPEKSLATEKDPPLYLQITATTKESLAQAVAIINDLIEKAALIKHTDKFNKYDDAKIILHMEVQPGFNLRAKLVGPGGAFLKHISQEANTRIQIKGRGSGYVEVADNKEADEPLFMHLSASSAESLAKGVKLVNDLVKTVRAEYERFLEMKDSFNQQQSHFAMPLGMPPPPNGVYQSAATGMYGGMYAGMHQPPGGLYQPPPPPSTYQPPPPPSAYPPPPPPSAYPPPPPSSDYPPPPPPQSNYSPYGPPPG